MGTTRASAQSAGASGSTGSEAAGETVYVFNVGSKDVTLIDVRSSPGARNPAPWRVSALAVQRADVLGWGADLDLRFPDNQVQAIAIDPRQVAVTKTITGLGKGPGHSLV